MNKHESMRGYFAYELYQQMKVNDKIYLLVGDLGYKVFDAHFKDFPDRCINTGASEQAMIDMAIGLAYDGKIPFCYSITTFLLRRPYEAIKLYVDNEKIPIRLVGSGRDQDYHIDGPSHDSSDAKALLATLPNIRQLWPEKKEEIADMVTTMVNANEPYFISLRKEVITK